ncbi:MULTISPECIES: HD-GYP domain-containing protein [unclassified Undibacterium]|uniref:HD-GYP domain-containing protein n=1 Tax=unclassified Undibacterium TaxID=2630295 RepID=UPI002AC905B7|nr:MULTISPECIES: HD-GYP domain-containing protein [unclassified Undibacterium]MEB0138350.1 HD-GYP domain-containing protein [Undibacterium sp. CCC2.1]MEB0172727.1 HD-GYP domain-containing protein [Undibacterium sp. CCC1.1]MEB0174725.1 HD-GYP domain-containing protein [Undibacterium sp. CCC3.4]MEB0213922.1 HD-GYP domain-containing protein [Undibacterium sp. 5I2]WPX42646.1 HD-GYP domain-containing protein [Undibacterium sp. CCC3.4]
MLKKIEISQLRTGMYVQELCGSWIDTPFWKKSFVLTEANELMEIQKSKIRQAWIDTSKGLDVYQAPTPAAVVMPEPPAEAPKVAAPRTVAPVSMDEELGRASMIVSKTKDAVCSMFSEARMGKAVDVGNAQEMVEEIADSVMRNPGALIGLARLKTKDDYTYMHSIAVCALMVALSKQLGLSEVAVREAGLAGLLHDIGKMMVSDDILNKPGKLTDAEFTSVKEHPAAGHKMLLEAQGVSEAALDVCLHHHEKMDGSGYPEGLRGEQISLLARMGAVCDVYDAITSNRPYKQGWCPAESLRKMAEWSKGHFDEKVFQAFVKSIGIYPVGTLVRLESGRLGVVVEQQIGKSLLAPKVRVFFSIKSMGYIVPELLDLAGPGLQDKIANREDAVKWGLKDIDRYWLGDAVPA